MTANNIIHLTNDTASEYISGNTPILIDFYAEWCAPCQRFMQLYPKLAAQYEAGIIVFAKVNVDEQEELADAHNVQAIPTFELYKGGKLVHRWEGIKTLLEMQKLIKKVL